MTQLFASRTIRLRTFTQLGVRDLLIRAKHLFVATIDGWDRGLRRIALRHHGSRSPWPTWVSCTRSAGRPMPIMSRRMTLRHASASTISRRHSRECRQGQKHAEEKVHRCVERR